MPSALFRSHRFLFMTTAVYIGMVQYCCIRCGPDKERIFDVVPREDGARNFS